jgi:hypothetical protein
VDEGVFAQLLSREPALLTALFTLVGGFLAQAGPGHIPSLKALGTSVTVSGLQGVLTRERVYSPATVRASRSPSPLLSVTPWLAHGAEPALAMGLVGFLAGFLLQLVGGATDLLQALGVAAGLAGTQGVLTRQQVYSPRTVALRQLAPAAGLTGILSGSLLAGAPQIATAQAGDRPPAATAAIPLVAVTPGATHPDPATEPGLVSLLQRYRPFVSYDSLESFYADSAAVMTDRPGNLLKRQDGSVIATAAPGSGMPQLGLGFLRAQRYPNGQPAAQTDYIDEVGGDYVMQARQMHSLPGYGDRVHGRVVIDSSGARWLQYWFFMYYDDPGFLGFGTHEGDIEMIQLRLDDQGQPDLASYSQHRSGVRASWSQLERAATPDGPVPVTFSARGSHANLLRAGELFSLRSFLPDHNDGQGHRVRPDLVVLSDVGTPWCLWPGSWGSTRASGVLGDIGIAANSPTAANRHLAWRDPAGFHASCDLPGDLAPAGAMSGLDLPGPPTPALSVQRSAQATVVRYSIPPDSKAPAATKIVVGLVSTDAAVPAITASAEVRGPSGTLELPLPPAGGTYEVRATTHAANGLASRTQSASLGGS